MDAISALFFTFGAAASCVLLLAVSSAEDVSSGLCSVCITPPSSFKNLLRFDIADESELMAIVGARGYRQGSARGHSTEG